MDKLLKDLKENKFLHYILIIIIGLILGIGIINIQIRDTHDGTIHLLRIIGTFDTLKIGQFPPLINQNFCNGAGYAINLFYTPLVTYLPLLIKFLTNNYVSALKVFGISSVIFSGISMYQFTYQVTKKRSIALFCAIFYMAAPYKLANLYKRFAIGEFTAAIFIPYIFMGLYNLFEQDGNKHYFITIGAVGLALSHTVSTFYIGIFALVYVLFNIKKIKEKAIIRKIIINILFIIILIAFFYFPLMEATSSSQYVITNNDRMMTNGNAASNNTVSILEFLLFNNDREQGWEVTVIIGIPVLFIFLSSAVIGKKVENEYKSIYIISIIFAIVSVFMASNLFPWKLMPDFLCKLQFPWRMMGFFVFFASFVCSVNLYNILNTTIKKDSNKEIFSVLLFTIIIIESVLYMSRFYTKDKTLDKEYEDRIISNPRISYMQINRDYMPIKALSNKDDYILNRKNITYVLNGNVKILEDNKKDLEETIKIENGKKGDMLEFPYYYYVGYEILLDNEKVLNSVESQNGYLSCILENDIDNGIITVQYKGTKIQKISFIVSLIGLICFILYVIYEKNKWRKK